MKILIEIEDNNLSLQDLHTILMNQSSKVILRENPRKPYTEKEYRQHIIKYIELMIQEKIDNYNERMKG